MKPYSLLISEFEPDGSLRDIYVFDTNIKQWNIVLKAITRTNYEYNFLHADEVIELPNDFDLIKALQESNPTILKIYITESIQINCHFFTDKEIEMDIDPNEILSETDYNALTRFLSWLSKITSSTVVLTHENAPELVILSVES